MGVDSNSDREEILEMTSHATGRYTNDKANRTKTESRENLRIFFTVFPQADIACEYK